MLRQTMVDSWYCLDRFVPEVISQVSRRSEVGNTKQRSLNTRLSSGPSAGTFTVSAGPYRNYHAKAGTKNEPWHVFGTTSKKGLENRSSRFEPKNSWLSFSRGSGPLLRSGWVFFKSRLQNDVRRFGRGLAGLFSQQIVLNLIKRCSNQHAEIFMNETNMRCFASVSTNRITSSWHQLSKISKWIVLIYNTLLT